MKTSGIILGILWYHQHIIIDYHYHRPCRRRHHHEEA